MSATGVVNDPQDQDFSTKEIYSPQGQRPGNETKVGDRRRERNKREGQGYLSHSKDCLWIEKTQKWPTGRCQLIKVHEETCVRMRCWAC